MHIALEIIVLILRVILSFFKAGLRWILPKKYKSIEGEICLITGAGSGIGRLMALEFARRGALMILWDINEQGNNETKKMIQAAGGTAFADKCDISKREEVYKAAERARNGCTGDITILVNNAGIVYGKDFLETSDEELEKTIQVNLLGHFWTMKSFLPKMLENNHGHIVSIASVLGLFPAPGMPDYVASKHGVVGFHRGVELDLKKYGKDGVKSTLVCPYHISTGLFRGVKSRFEVLLPSLTPEECVTAIMHAVLTDQNMVAIPRSMYLCNNLETWLPHEVSLLNHEFMGTFDSMKRFVPNRDYQKQAVNIDN